MTTKKRGKLDIYTDILTVCSSCRKKTEIMYRAYLSYGLLVKYLQELEENHLISNKEGLICLTDDGERVLKLLLRRKEIIKEIEDIESKVTVLIAQRNVMNKGTEATHSEQTSDV